MPPHILFCIKALLSSAKQQGNAPQTCQPDDGINDAAEDGILTAEDPCHQVKLKNTHETPIDRADN